MQTENSLANSPRSLSSCLRFRARCLNSGVLFFHVFHVRAISDPHSMEAVTFPNVSLLGVSPGSSCHGEAFPPRGTLLTVMASCERLYPCHSNKKTERPSRRR